MSEEWKVDPKQGFEIDNMYMKAGCHHRRTYGGRGDPSPCGGCYARATEALQRIRDTGDASIAADVLDAMRAEKKEAHHA